MKYLLFAAALFAAICAKAQTTPDFESTPVRLHKSVNVDELKRQYSLNKEQWDAAIKWLSSNDLDSISKGRHPIEGTKLVASVEDTENAPIEKRQSESHYHHIDLQMVISGVEGFAIIDNATSTPNCKWREDVIHYNYDVKLAEMLIGRRGDAFIFFPSDWHIAKVQTPHENQKFRVIVIKLDYIE